MENGPFEDVFPIEHRGFSMAMLVYQRVDVNKSKMVTFLHVMLPSNIKAPQLAGCNPASPQVIFSGFHGRSFFRGIPPQKIHPRRLTWNL